MPRPALEASALVSTASRKVRSNCQSAVATSQTVPPAESEMERVARSRPPSPERARARGPRPGVCRQPKARFR